MEKDINRYKWLMPAHIRGGKASAVCEPAHDNADQEVNAPGEYAVLQQWLRMYRPGRQLL